jgi:hypothetical protein
MQWVLIAPATEPPQGGFRISNFLFHRIAAAISDSFNACTKSLVQRPPF